MYQRETAHAKALNLQSINYYLTKETSATYIADDLDDIIFNFIFCYGQANDTTISPESFAAQIYTLTQLRNLFIKTALVNKEDFELQRIMNDFEDITSK